MKFGIILQSNSLERIWNTFRLGITALNAGHKVEIFLMNEGAELESIPDAPDFDISQKILEYKKIGGEIFACQTCLKIRGKEKSNVCPISTMPQLLQMIEQSDKVLAF